jgi:2-oxoglutarate dehydrogenase E2 component (dihydrolipoamide succinyltransferase)/2-oxoisovalerate dehydrogenase E2 component (dihydrolipoyl transacylase)
LRVVIPQVGQSIAEATIVKWFKKAGDRIEKGETLVEIGTDKINTEIPAPETGIVQSILVPEGETVPILTEIAVISDGKSEDVDVAAAAVAPNADQKVQPVIEKSSGERHSPMVRRLAQEHNVDLSKVKGTGADGRITKEDVLNYAVQSKSTASDEEKRVPMSRMRKLIAEHMSLSRRTAADVSTFFEIDMSAVVQEREKALAKSGTKLTYLPFIVKAVTQGLQAFPVLNSSIEGDQIVYKKHCNIGMAVSIENGLIVPVLKHVEKMSVSEIARGFQDLSERARSNRLSPSDLEGGTFTITNPGVFGALLGTPIIHQPQVAILGVGAVVKRAVVVDDQIVIRPMSYFSLSYDHRALDGATADQFLAFIKNVIENECPLAQ